MSRILVLNGSPSGKNSITLQTLLFMEKYWKDAEFEILHVGQRIRSYEKDFSQAEASLKKAEMILFCYPVYTFLVPAQLHRFIELIKENKVCLKGKYASQITTSKHFYDTTAHRFIQDNCDDLGLLYIRGLSADMEDLLSKKGQKEAAAFTRYLRWCMKKGFYEGAHYGVQDVPNENEHLQSENNSGVKAELPATGESACDTEKQIYVINEQTRRTEKQICGTNEQTRRTDKQICGINEHARRTDKQICGINKQACKTDKISKIAIVADLSEGEESDTLRDMIRDFVKNSKIPCELFNIRDFPFKGGCLGCFHCASDGICIYKDGFDSWLREAIQKADAIVYAYKVKDHSMGSLFKTFDDRQFCNGHRTVTMGRPLGYLVDGCLSVEENLCTVMEARAQVGGNFLAGIACSEKKADMERQIRTLAETLGYAIRHNYRPPKNFYGVGGLKIFRDLIYQMQGLMREDHRFYKEHGFYDFPQKHRGRIIAMYLLGALMSNPKLGSSMKGKMTEGMLMPYRKLLKEQEKE